MGQDDEAVLRINRSKMLSFAELSCEIPTQQLPMVNIDFSPSQGRPIGGVAIQLSNDGVNFTRKSSNFVVFDSKCVQCNNETNCEWKVKK